MTIASSTRPIGVLLLTLALIAAPAHADFRSDLDRVDAILKDPGPGHIAAALRACANRRRFAVQLFDAGFEVRANRALRACFRQLEIPDEAPVEQVEVPSADELAQKARREVERALTLEPDLARGLALFRECASCHTPEGSGLPGGTVPQIAGQHRSVVIKQLADIRAGNRQAVLMVPYSAPEIIGGAQGIADVAGYIDSLEIHVDTDKGEGKDLVHGQALYEKHCVSCHGPEGEGDAGRYIPRIQSQHYNYMVRQFESIRDGRRKNANPEMVAQIQGFSERDVSAVLDYVSRLEPPELMQAPAGWKNPDFVHRPFE